LPVDFLMKQITIMRSSLYLQLHALKFSTTSHSPLCSPIFVVVAAVVVDVVAEFAVAVAEAIAVVELPIFVVAPSIVFAVVAAAERKGLVAQSHNIH
jgi:hypothetical protein